MPNLNVDFKRVGLAVAIIVIVYLVAMVRVEHYRADEAASVYRNPQTRVVRVTGPVRIVTRIVERAGGEKETTIEETRGAVTEATESAPVPLSVALAPPYRDRWLLGVGHRNLAFGDPRTYSAWAGRDVGPRAQALLGVGYHDGAEVQALVLLRFGR